jgi:hypothetical protein
MMILTHPPWAIPLLSFRTWEGFLFPPRPRRPFQPRRFCGCAKQGAEWEDSMHPPNTREITATATTGVTGSITGAYTVYVDEREPVKSPTGLTIAELIDDPEAK